MLTDVKIAAFLFILVTGWSEEVARGRDITEKKEEEQGNLVHSF